MTSSSPLAEKVSMSIGLDFEDSGVFYLTEEHKKVIRSLFLKLFSDSPFCFLGSCASPEGMISSGVQYGISKLHSSSTTKDVL